MALTEKLTITHIELTTTKPEIAIREFRTAAEAAKAAAQTILPRLFITQKLVSCSRLETPKSLYMKNSFY